MLPSAEIVLQRGAFGPAERLGFTGIPLEVPTDSRPRWCLDKHRRLFHCGDRQGVELLWSRVAHSDLGTFRRWMLNLARRAPLRRFLHVEEDDQGGRLIGVVRPGRFTPSGAGARPLDDALASEIQQLAAHGREHLAQLIADAVHREDITAQFFRAFRRHLLALERLWQNIDPASDNAYARRDLTLALLCRLMFVTFISRTRGLAGQRNYLRWLIEQRQGRPIFRALLQPLFFGVLNTPTAQRSADAQRLGDLPFLNGGLFHPLPIEAASPGLDLPDEPVSLAIHELFEGFELGPRELDRDRERPCIDPAMLGHVFEALMHADERSESGTFYTPAALVATLVSESLANVAHSISPRASIWVAESLAGRPVVPRPENEARQREGRLAGLRVVDPAVGSGALLLGTLDALVRLRCTLAVLLGRRLDIASLRRAVISHNLFGVDIKAGAVRLCELRLWLSLIAEGETDEPLLPLPNLDHHIRQGDSLLEPLHLSRASREAPRPLIDLSEVHGPEKDQQVRARRAEECAWLHLQVRRELEAITARIAAIDEEAQRPDLFARQQGLRPAARAERNALVARRHELEPSDRALARGELPWFSYAAAFPEVAEAGGFDLVISNPPWVRIHQVPAAQREQLRRRYRVCRGAGSGFLQQTDLAAPFVERSTEILRPNGYLCMLLPSKLFRTQAGAALRRWLVDEQEVTHYADHSLCRTRSFAASNYPAMLTLRKRPPHQGSRTQVTLTTPQGQSQSARIRQSALAAPGGAGDPWPALPPHVVTLFARLRAAHPTMGDVGLEPRLGIKTGRNEVFIARSWEELDGGRVKLTMGDGSRLVVAAEHAPLVLRGRDVRPFRAGPEHRLLLPYEASTGRPLARLPPELLDYFERHRSNLARRRDARATSASWKLFRTDALVPGPKLVWPDLAPRLSGCCLPGTEPVIPLNTCYFMRLRDEDDALCLTVVFNSTWYRLLAVVAAEPAMSGYFRFMVPTVRGLPSPARLRDDPAMRRRLVHLYFAASEQPAETQGEIDAVVANMLGLMNNERRLLHDLAMFYPGALPTTGGGR